MHNKWDIFPISQTPLAIDSKLRNRPFPHPSVRWQFWAFDKATNIYYWERSVLCNSAFYSWDCISSVEALQAVAPSLGTSPGTATLPASDSTGSSSFDATGNWSTGGAPGWTNNYVVNGLNLPTPADSNTHNFIGSSVILTNSGGLRLTTGSGNLTGNLSALNGSTINPRDAIGTLAIWPEPWCWH